LFVSVSACMQTVIESFQGCHNATITILRKLLLGL
jgi:hypothetical protein